MILDSSALVSILFEETGFEPYAEAMLGASSLRLSAASYVECGIVVDARRDPVLSRRFDELLEALGVQIEDLTEEQARLARIGYRDFGRGSGHPAQLNLGDSFAYALAISRRDELLFKGDDFTHTDVRPALQSTAD